MSNLDSAPIITAVLSYKENRQYQITVQGQDGPLVSDPFSRMGEATEVALRLARKVLPGRPEIDVDVKTPPPPWLRKGQVVRIIPWADVTSELGWVGGFFDGGVYVNGLETGGGIVPPEYLDDNPQASTDELAQIEAAKLDATRQAAARRAARQSGD